MRQHTRRGTEDLTQQRRVTAEVRDEHLDAAVGIELADQAHGLGVEPGALVVEIVARDTRDRGVAQAHRAHRLRDATRLVAVQRGGLAGVDLAEVAPARALLTADEERRLAVLPAFVDVGAARLLADGVQTFALDQRPHRGVLRTGAQARLDPLGLALDGCLGVLHL